MLVILAATVPWTDFKGHTHWSRVQWIPFVTPPVRVTDIAINVLLYMPFGLWFAQQAGANDDRAWRRACLYALALSLMTEYSQLYSHSRFPAVQDTMCNVFGTLLGTGVLGRLTLRRTAPQVEGGLL